MADHKEIIADLEKELAALGEELRSLQARAEALQVRSADLKVTIRVLSGHQKLRAKDTDPKQSTPAAIMEVLEAGGTYTVPDLTTKMLAGGFQTRSKKPQTIVRTALHRLEKKGRVYRKGTLWGTTIQL